MKPYLLAQLLMPPLLEAAAAAQAYAERVKPLVLPKDPPLWPHILAQSASKDFHWNRHPWLAPAAGKSLSWLLKDILLSALIICPEHRTPNFIIDPGQSDKA